jgi:hypothetical protein
MGNGGILEMEHLPFGVRRLAAALRPASRGRPQSGSKLPHSKLRGARDSRHFRILFPGGNGKQSALPAKMCKNVGFHYSRIFRMIRPNPVFALLLDYEWFIE